MTLFEKCYDYKAADITKGKGVYPYFRPIQESEGPTVLMEGRKMVMAGSNNYLGLTAHPKVKEAAVKAIEKYGTSCSGSRFLTGTIDLHIELEEKIARFMGKEAALLFSTGFQAGQGVIQPLLSKGDYVLSDKDNHASIVAGNMLGAAMQAKVVRYKHNDMEDLERRLKMIPETANRLIVTDGIFSALGSLAHLDKLKELAWRYQAQVLVDDAHGFGVMGEGGKGTAHYFNAQDDIDLIVCTFSKTLASLGGFVAGEERVINYLKHKSPALIFSASPTPASVASASAALDILVEQPELSVRVRRNADRVRQGLRESGFQVIDGEAAIVPVIIGDDEKTFAIWKMLYEEGVFVNAFISPATPPGMQMLRTSYMASHEDEHLDFIVEKFRKIGKKLGLPDYQYQA